MSREMSDAVRLVSSLKVGDAVSVVVDGRELTGLTVSRGPRRADGVFGSVESTRVTVTYGPGRYAFELCADAVASGRQSVTRLGVSP